MEEFFGKILTKFALTVKSYTKIVGKIKGKCRKTFLRFWIGFQNNFTKFIGNVEKNLRKCSVNFDKNLLKFWVRYNLKKFSIIFSQNVWQILRYYLVNYKYNQNWNHGIKLRKFQFRMKLAESPEYTNCDRRGRDDDAWHRPCLSVWHFNCTRRTQWPPCKRWVNSLLHWTVWSQSCWKAHMD